MAEIPRFQIGHMCTGCPVSTRLHTGCIVSNDVRTPSEVKEDQNIVRSADSSEKKTQN